MCPQQDGIAQLETSKCTQLTNTAYLLMVEATEPSVLLCHLLNIQLVTVAATKLLSTCGCLLGSLNHDL